MHTAWSLLTSVQILALEIQKKFAGIHAPYQCNIYIYPSYVEKAMPAVTLKITLGCCSFAALFLGSNSF